MTSPCDECSEIDGAPGDPSDAPHKTERAFKVYTRRVKLTGGTNIPSVVATVPAAAAVDVYVRYRDDIGNTEDPFGSNEQWTMFAVTQTTRSQIGPFRTTDLSPLEDGVQRRIFAIRDVPAESFELSLLPVGIGAGSVGMWDVVMIAWGREPTGVGPFGLLSAASGDLAGTVGSSTGAAGLLPMAIDAGVNNPVWRPLTVNRITVYNPPAQGSNESATNLNVLPVGLFQTAAPALANNDLFPFQLDASGNLKVTAVPSAGGASKVTSAAYEASHASAGAKTVQAVYVSSKAPAAGFIFIYDLAALPANGTLPDFPPIPIPAGPSFVSADNLQRRHTNGLVVAFSSTQATLTLGTADCWFEGHF